MANLFANDTVMHFMHVLQQNPCLTTTLYPTLTSKAILVSNLLLNFQEVVLNAPVLMSMAALNVAYA